MKEEVIQLTQDLVKTPSIEGQSIDAGQILHDFLVEHGFDAELNEYKDGEANVFAELGPKNTSQLLVSGHVDTVPIGDRDTWTHDPYSAKIVDGELWGRGSVDMKGGVATLAGVMVDLLEYEDDLNQRIFFAATAEEETGLQGAKQYVQEGLIDNTSHVIIAEPTDLAPKVTEKGIMWFDIRAHGKQSHASRPDLGHNAIEGLSALIPKIHQLIPTKESPGLGRTSLNTGIITGGTAANVVPEYAEARFDCRTTPGVENEEVLGAIRTLLVEESEPISYVLEVIENTSAIISPDNTFAEKLAAETRILSDLIPELGGVHYATDGAVFMEYLSHKVPFVIYGPGSTELLHQTNERLEVAQLDIARKAYVNTILDTIAN